MSARASTATTSSSTPDASSRRKRGIAASDAHGGPAGLGSATTALLPALAVLVYAFTAGGYFPGATAWGVIALGGLALGLLARDRLAPAGADRALRVAMGAAVLLALWTLASTTWSGGAWRALTEFQRTALYALALGVFGSYAVRASIGRRMAGGLAAAIALVCLAALVARLLPDLYPLPADFDGYGLAYPVSYANALGILAAVGLLLLLHVSSDERGAARTRVLAAAAVPVVAATLALTGSSGAAVAAAVGVAVYVVAARPAGFAAWLVATVPTAALAVASALGAEALAGPDASGPAAIDQGRRVAAVVALAVANAALLRWLALRRGRARRSGGASGADAATSDEPRSRNAPTGASREGGRAGSSSTRAGRRVVLAAVAVAAFAAAAAVGLASGGDGGGARPGATAANAPAAARPARLDHWAVALTGFAESPLIGGGAGSYEGLSQRERSPRAAVRDAHSLPLETLAELGLVGAGLLLALLAAIAVGLVEGLRRGDRGTAGIALAVATAWALHAAIDWDWEMPVVTLPVLALCAAALGSRSAGDGAGTALGGERGRAAEERARRRAPRLAARVGAAAALVALIAGGVAVAISDAQLRGAAALARAGDCAPARAPHLLAGLRPEPHAVLGGCELRAARRARGTERRARADRAHAAFSAAARRDPADLDLREAVLRARRLAGGDPGR